MNKSNLFPKISNFQRYTGTAIGDDNILQYASITSTQDDLSPISETIHVTFNRQTYMKLIKSFQVTFSSEF